jgi:uncharacterized protein
MKNISYLVLSVLLFLPTIGFADSEKQKENWTMVPTQNLTLQSEILKRNIRLQIGVPANYSKEKSYGVIYYLDAFSTSGILRETALWLQVGKHLPELITVGIELEVNTMDEWYKERSFILTPTKSNIYENFGILESWTGGGPDFLKCIKEEIIPFVDSKFNTKAGDRTLVGHSFGGLFALYTLFESPQLFNKYLISSPSLPWDDRFIFKMESEYAKKQKELSANIFLSVGSLENLPDDMMVNQLQELSSILKLRKYKGLNISSIVFEDESHYSVIPAAYSKGLMTLYSSEMDTSVKN